MPLKTEPTDGAVAPAEPRSPSSDDSAAALSSSAPPPLLAPRCMFWLARQESNAFSYWSESRHTCIDMFTCDERK